MATGRPVGLELTDEEAFALLELCMTSPEKLTNVSELALKKLAEFCSKSNSTYQIIKSESYLKCCEPTRAEA